MSDHATPAKPLITRRTALAAAVGVGVTAVAASVTQVASASDKKAKKVALEGPVVVRVRDLKSGRIDIYNGTRRTQVVDKDLAAALAEHATKA